MIVSLLVAGLKIALQAPWFVVVIRQSMQAVDPRHCEGGGRQPAKPLGKGLGEGSATVKLLDSR